MREREHLHDEATGVLDDERQAPVPGRRTLIEARRPPPPGSVAPGTYTLAQFAAPTRIPHHDQIQRAFGRHDVSHVRAYTDEAARASAAGMGAEAYAFGDAVAFAGDPSLHVAAHEAAHVVQQRAGVAAASAEHEVHAERVAEAVVAGRSAEALLDEAVAAGSGVAAQVVQRFDRHHATGPAGQGPNTVAVGAATETGTDFQDPAKLGAKTASEFLGYADTQADWSLKITDAAARGDLRQLMTWLRASVARRAALGDFTVDDLVKAKADLAALDAYARSRDQKTAPVEAQASVVDVVSWGKDILKLEAATAPAVLHQIFTSDEFDQLRVQGKVDDFARYVTTCKPVLHADGGVEVASFLKLAVKADPSSFTDIKDVRNYHRFDADGLVALRAAQAGNAGNKPLTLILHSALDHNGAFHHDPEMTATLTAPSNHTLMIEGATTLAAISSRLPALVAVHGREETDPKHAKKTVRRIDQVMFAGHGSSQSIELAGSVATAKDGTPLTSGAGDELVMNDNDLNLRAEPGDPASVKKAAETRKFMQQVMNLMSQDPATPHGRMVFNACLTASNEIQTDEVDEKASPDAQGKAMLKAIQKHPSLVETMRAIAADSGRKVDVRGGNGSFGVVGLIDGKGALDIVADGTDPDGDGISRTLDPELTNPDKLVYAEHGTDAEGCLSAVAESWAKDRKTCLEAVERRRKTPVNAGWEEAVIQALLDLVVTSYAANGNGIVALSRVADGFKELASAEVARVWIIEDLVPDADWAHLESKLSTHGGWTGQKFVPLVFYQAWFLRNAARKNQFLDAVGAMSVREARVEVDWLWMDELVAQWATLIPMKPANPPPAGELRLALRNIVDSESLAPAETRSFLASFVTGGKFTIDITGPLDKVSTEDDVLRSLGLHPALAAGGVAPADPTLPPPDANVDMDDDGKKNESVVEAMSATGKVTATELYVRDQPTTKGKNHPTKLAKGDEVYIMGQTGDWYLIDHGGTRGYSSKHYIVLV